MCTYLWNCASIIIKNAAATIKRRSMFANLFAIGISNREILNDEFLPTPYDRTLTIRKIKRCRSLVALANPISIFDGRLFIYDRKRQHVECFVVTLFTFARAKIGNNARNI